MVKKEEGLKLMASKFDLDDTVYFVKEVSCIREHPCSECGERHLIADMKYVSARGKVFELQITHALLRYHVTYVLMERNRNLHIVEERNVFGTVKEAKAARDKANAQLAKRVKGKRL